MSRHLSVWHYQTLVTAVLLLQFVPGMKCQENVGYFNCPVNTDGYVSQLMKPVNEKDCDATIRSEKLHMKCNFYGTFLLNLPLLSNTTARILLTESMETFEDINDILRKPPNSTCLKLISIRIRKVNSRDSETLKYSQYFSVIPNVAIFPLMFIREMDLLTTFNSDHAVGIVHYNKTCLQVANSNTSGQNNYSEFVVVSNCISFTDVVRRFITSDDTFSYAASIIFEELFSKDFLNISVDFMNKMIFEGYNYSIPSVAFKTEIFKSLPTESLIILSLNNVKYVEIQSNNIVSIRNGEIPLMKSLQTLNLKDCKIEVIEEKAFEGVFHLIELNLQGNRLKKLPEAFQALINLNILNLQGNGGKETHEFQYLDYILVSNAYLLSLDFSNMGLLDFWENLGNLSKLQYLNLSNCCLNYVPAVNISHFMPSLIYLNLSSNNLTTVSINVLSQLDKLQFLDLSRNQLIHIPYNFIISILPDLKFLSLNTNNIPDFLPLKLDNETALESLDLSFNRINLWKTTQIILSYQFLSVNLIGNNITEVNSHMISDFKKLKHVELADNPFDCKSCALRSFLTWLKFENSSTDFLVTPYTCYLPKEYFNEIISNVTLEPCREEVFDSVYNVVIPSLVVVALLGSATVIVIIYRWHLLYFMYLVKSKVQKSKRNDDDRIFKYDAFVSYCTADRNWVVDYLIPAVEFQEPKLHLCVHERDFDIGETIMNNVIECIDSSHTSIFVLSKHFIKSQWCQWELQMARHKLFDDRRDVLILIMLGEISSRETPKILKRLISKRTYLQWPVNENYRRLFWKRLKDAIGKCCCTNK